MTERDPEGHDDDEARLTFEGLPLVDGGRRAVARKPGATGGRLVPRPEKGLAFADALDESMRDHFAVYAALAKQAVADPRWLTKGEVLHAHERQLAEHGGPPGLLDEGLLERALARAENLQAYRDPDVADLAAAYAYGLARNHAFVDGNKRASLAACTTFLLANGYRLPVDDAVNIDVWMRLADESLSEADLADWLRARVVPLP